MSDIIYNEYIFKEHTPNAIWKYEENEGNTTITLMKFENKTLGNKQSIDWSGELEYFNKPTGSIFKYRDKDVTADQLIISMIAALKKIKKLKEE